MKLITENTTNLISETIGKVDYYCFDEKPENELFTILNNGIYRSICFFDEYSDNFKDFNLNKIALINYPPERHTFRNLYRLIEKVDCDEVEFPWSSKYITKDISKWQRILKLSIEKGIILRPMLEFGVMGPEDIIETITYIKKTGINHIMTSSGLIPDITTLKKWEAVKNSIPSSITVKIGGVLTVDEINEYISSSAEYIATTMLIKK